jgi:two-component system KDP operon response regulator KdpE
VSGPHILIVDDEPAIRQTLGSYLTKRGYATATASSGEEALDSVQSRRPDLVLLDLVMPGIGGLEACRRIRARSSVPIIVLSVIDREPEKVEALEAGADDYLTKPFGPDELVARIGVALRHRAGLASGVEPVYRCGDLTVDLGTRNVTLGGGQIRLTTTEYDVLRCLAAASGVRSHTVSCCAKFGGQSTKRRFSCCALLSSSSGRSWQTTHSGLGTS